MLFCFGVTTGDIGSNCRCGYGTESQVQRRFRGNENKFREWNIFALSRIKIIRSQTPHVYRAGTYMNEVLMLDKLMVSFHFVFVLLTLNTTNTDEACRRVLQATEQNCQLSSGWSSWRYLGRPFGCIAAAAHDCQFISQAHCLISLNSHMQFCTRDGMKACLPACFSSFFSFLDWMRHACAFKILLLKLKLSVNFIRHYT